jgi:hypothetical protein
MVAIPVPLETPTRDGHVMAFPAGLIESFTKHPFIKEV